MAAGWLVVDFLTTPPSIKIDAVSARHSKWNIADADKQGFYISAQNESGKTWWLTMGDSPLVKAISGVNAVIVFRPAVLSPEKRCTFRFDKDDGSK